jgi:hypothetical protein
MAAHDAAQVRICMDKFTALETKMATVLPMVERLDEEIFNHGKDGLKTVVLKHIEHVETLEAERDKSLKQERDDVKSALSRHNFRVMLLVGIFALLVALMQLAIEWSHRSTGHTLFDHPKTTGQLLTAHNQTELAGKEW